jgi:hypothetical protein
MPAYPGPDSITFFNDKMYNACMRICLCCAILLLSLLAGCSFFSSESPTTSPVTLTTVVKVDSEAAVQLSRKFCPVFYFNGDPETIESYEPDPVQIMIDVAVVRDSGNPAFSEKASISKMPGWTQSTYYIDVAGLNPKNNSSTEYKAAYDSQKARYMPTVYTRVREADASGYTIVQYWLFYYMNDWRNTHEGDWEMAQLNFPGHTAREILAKGETPVFMALSQHQSGQKMSWSTMIDKKLVKDTHPSVYVAKGSHANYFTPGQSWSVLDFDKTGVTTWRTINPEQLDIILLNESEPAEQGLEWLQFKGDWGEYTGFSISVLDLQFWQSGPSGPPWSDGGNKSEKWANPGKWATGLSEYPEPFWKSLLKLPGDWAKLAVFSVFSPADLHIYDSQGRHVGLNEKGVFENQIPGAIYITPAGTDYKTILIPDADEKTEYRVVARGTGAGTMDLKTLMPDTLNKLTRFLEYNNVPVTRTMVAQTRIKPVELKVAAVPTAPGIPSLSTRDTTTKLELDSDGDGTFETEGTPGIFEKTKVLRPVSSTRIDIKPDALNLSASVLEKSITAYIELPANMNPKDIDISSILLFGKISPAERTAAVVDHDQNGVYELAVKFDLQSVVNYLTSTKQVQGDIVFNISFTVNGQIFTGKDTLAVSNSTLDVIKR